MTDRYHSLIVVLEKDIRQDDAEALIQAIQQFHGVAIVSGAVADPGTFMAQTRAKLELRKKVLELL